MKHIKHANNGHSYLWLIQERSNILDLNLIITEFIFLYASISSLLVSKNHIYTVKLKEFCNSLA